MFFILSKTLDFLLMPVTWLVIIFSLALWAKNPHIKQFRLKSGFFLLILFTNPFLINVLLLSWETPATPLKEMKQDYDVGIILSGLTANTKSPKDRVHTNKGVDRVLHTLMLYRNGKIKKILITGGDIDIYGNKKISGAQKIATMLKLSEVPEEDIILEEKARNTRENALYTSQILQDKFPNQSYLLITSAFHMRRALGCFKQAGVEVTPFSADFYSTDFSLNLDSFVPTEKALYYWYILTHEVLGYVVYGLLGYMSF